MFKLPQITLTKKKKVNLEKSSDETQPTQSEQPIQIEIKKKFQIPKIDFSKKIEFPKKLASKNSGSNKNVNKNIVAGIAIYADALHCTIPSENRHEVIPLEMGCIQNSSIRDFTLLEKAFKQLAELVKIPVVIGLPPGDVMMRPVAFPDMNNDDLKSTIDLNFEEYFPFSRDEAVLDFTKINIPSNPNLQNISQQIHVLIAAARRSCIEEILKIIESSGLKLEAIEPYNLAILRAIPESQNDLCLVADVNEFFTSITIAWNGEGIFFRASNRGNDLDSVTTDILNTAQFTENQYRGFNIKMIILTGNEILSSRLAETLGNRAQIINLPSEFASSDGLSKRNDNGIYIDLRPRAYLELQKRLHSFNINRVASILFTGVFIFSSSASIALSLIKANKISEAIEIEHDFIDNLQGQLNALEQYNDSLHAQENDVVHVLNFVKDDIPVLEVMNVLEANTGVGIEFRAINFGKDKSGVVATLEAVSENEDLIIAMTEGLSRSGIFKSIIMPGSNKGENEKVNFTLILNIADIAR